MGLNIYIILYVSLHTDNIMKIKQPYIYMSTRKHNTLNPKAGKTDIHLRLLQINVCVLDPMVAAYNEQGSYCMPVCGHTNFLQLCRLLVTLWTVAWQAPLSLGFSRQECWSRLPDNRIYPLQFKYKKILSWDFRIMLASLFFCSGQ